jgi:hypothetical protein
VDVQAETNLSKALLKEMLNLEERYLVSEGGLLEITRDQPVVTKTQVVSDASLAIKETQVPAVKKYGHRKSGKDTQNMKRSSTESINR